MRILVIISLIFAVAFAITASYASSNALGQITTTQPNIVYVVTDDMRKDDLAYMPKTQNLIFGKGITYDNAFVTTSQCCPSRSSMLTGKYVHNHGVKANEGSNGGAGAFKQNGNEQHTVATWLHDAGYTNMLAGKYLNGYKGKGPLGWDEWHGMGGVNYGSGNNYTTDRIRDQGVDFIDRQQGPFFMY